MAFFASRGISKETLDRNGVCGADAYFAPLGGMAPAVAFPYKRDGEVVNVKYRSEKKHFTQVRGAEKVLYGLDDVVGQADIIIVEGEMDKLALEEAGKEEKREGAGAVPQATGCRGRRHREMASLGVRAAAGRGGLWRSAKKVAAPPDLREGRGETSVFSPGTPTHDFRTRPRTRVPAPQGSS